MVTPTFRTIANACGVTPSTVSRALSNSPLIPVATRERIWARALDMGWKPNPIVSAFMAHLRTTKAPQFHATLAYILSFPHLHKSVKIPGYHQKHFEGAQLRAQSFGYKLEPFWFRDANCNGKILSSILLSRGIPGVIFYGEGISENEMDGFDWNSFACASWGGTNPHFPKLHRAATSHLHDMRLLLEVIRASPCQRVALILSGNQDQLAGEGFFSAFHYEKEHRSGPRHLKYLRLTTWDATPEVCELVERFLREFQPDVIIGEENVWRVLQTMGWKVPERIRFVSPFWSADWPHVAGIDHRPEVIGRNTSDLITSQLLQNERGIPEVPKLVLSEGQWVDGPSFPNP